MFPLLHVFADVKQNLKIGHYRTTRMGHTVPQKISYDPTILVIGKMSLEVEQNDKKNI